MFSAAYVSYFVHGLGVITPPIWLSGKRGVCGEMGWCDEGGCIHSRIRGTSPRQTVAATETVSMHPTGMHSSFLNCIFSMTKNKNEKQQFSGDIHFVAFFVSNIKK